MPAVNERHVKLSLTAKLLISFLLVGLTGTAVLAYLGSTATADEFGQFMFDYQRESLAQQLADFYAQNHSWEGVPAALLNRRFGAPPGPGRAGRLPPFVLADVQGTVVVAGPGFQAGESIGQGLPDDAFTIESDEQAVGTLVMQRGAFGQGSAEVAFLQRVNVWLRLGAIGSTMAAVVVGAVLARSVTRPLNEMTGAARAVAAGELDTQVPVRSSDELGELASAFNQMNANLAHARDLRRQMTADIAHELRTPISVILGHAEGIRDAVLEPSDETLGIIHDEAVRLERLVDDLRLLSLMDAGELPLEIGPTQPEELVHRAVVSHRAVASEKGVELDVELAAELPSLELDGDRIMQVLHNLLTNALRHTPPGGRIVISGQLVDGRVRIQVSDSGPGIPEAHLPHLFERFYRIDQARQRDGYGSGLGLAIARSLVEAQGGTLRASNQAQGGAVFTLDFPSPSPQV